MRDGDRLRRSVMIISIIIIVIIIIIIIIMNGIPTEKSTTNKASVFLFRLISF